MKRSFVSLAALFCLTVACADSVTEPVDAGATPQLSSAAVVHNVSAGGNDICGGLGLPNGCDANYSLVALERADGTVSGQWQDSFAGGTGGLHMVVDCVNVVGNGAVIGGVITQARGVAAGLEGARALTAVVDNGTSSNDPPDQISFTLVNAVADCRTLAPAALALIPLTNGQVTVR
jgi:hypothetical protein